MTKIRVPRELTDEQTKEISELFNAIELSSNEQIDNAIWEYGRLVVYAYRFGLVTDSQKKRLSDYRLRKESMKSKELDLNMSRKLMILETEYEEPPRIYQQWMIDWRIVVASTRTVYKTGKDDREVANWWEEMILEIYRSTTPKAYEYAKNKYQLYVKQ